MDQVIEAAIKLLVAKLTDKSTAETDLKFTQAALNLAHTASVLRHTPK